MLIEIPAVIKHKYTLIFLHGLGDTGHGWASQFKYFQDKIPSFRMIFPTAPVQPVTINGGFAMNSWYDIKSMDIGGASPDDTSNRLVDLEGLNKSKIIVEDIVRKEIDSGRVESAEQIVIGGFSQGGAVTLHTLLNSKYKFGGAIVLSSYLASDKIAAEGGKNSDTPVFMGHGSSDTVVQFKYGKMSFEKLEKDGILKNIEFQAYQGMDHSSCDQEMSDLFKWINKLEKSQEVKKSEL